jgi:hypothetical protein
VGRRNIMKATTAHPPTTINGMSDGVDEVVATSAVP